MNTPAAMCRCFYCNEPAIIVVHKNLKDVSDMDGKVFDMTPCEKCAAYMKEYVIILGYDPEKSAPDWNIPKGPGWMPDPWRSGHYIVVKDRFFDPLRGQSAHGDAACDFALKHRWTFIPGDVCARWDAAHKARKEAN